MWFPLTGSLYLSSCLTPGSPIRMSWAHVPLWASLPIRYRKTKDSHLRTSDPYRSGQCRVLQAVACGCACWTCPSPWKLAGIAGTLDHIGEYIVAEPLIIRCQLVAQCRQKHGIKLATNYLSGFERKLPRINLWICQIPRANLSV